MQQVICAGGIIVNKKGKFLLGKRSEKKEWAPGLWDIPGGHALKEEHPLLTLRREIKEETSISIRNARLLVTMDVPDKADTFFTYHIYVVTAYKGKPYNRSKEHTKLQWFTREELNSLSIALPVYLPLIDGL